MSSSSSGVTRVTWGVLCLALLASGFVWYASRGSQGARSHARARSAPAPALLDAVPPGPELIVSADVQGLGREMAEQLLSAGGGVLLGLKELCGFEPVLSLRQVALAVTKVAVVRDADFAVIAQTSLEPEKTLRCAEAVIRRRGGEPVRSTLGAFRSVRDAARPIGEVAIRGDGLFVLSGGQYFRDVIDTASGTPHGDEAARLRTQLHAGIRRRLGPSPLVASLLISSQLANTGVQALGVGVQLERDVRLRGYVLCPANSGCKEAQAMIAQFKSEAAQDPQQSWLTALRVEPHGAELTLGAQVTREQFGAMLSELLAP